MQRGTTFVTFCLLSWMMYPFQNWIYSYRKEFALKSKFFPVRIDPYFLRDIKMKMAELLPLKVYPYALVSISGSPINKLKESQEH